MGKFIMHSRGCRCNDCGIRITLNPLFWEKDKIAFIERYHEYVRVLGREKLDNVFSHPIYDDIRDSISKLSVLL